MADRSAIEWTDATWNPVRARHRATGKLGHHCEHVSEGCRFCYAERMNLWRGTRLAYKPGHRDDVEILLDETTLLQPLRWHRPRMIFVGSMTDLFADFVSDAMLDYIFAVMALAPQHTFQVLTKRPERMRAYLAEETVHDRVSRAAVDLYAAHPTNAASTHVRFMRVDGVDVPSGPWPLPNVWLGTSCEDQPTADARVPELLATPAAIHIVSAEPLLGPIDFTDFDPDGNFHPYGAHGWSALWGGSLGRACLDWIIVGGESGPQARPMHPDWARAIRDQCAAAGVAFHFKQWGEWRPSQDSLRVQEAYGSGSLSPNIAWPDGAICWGAATTHGGNGHPLDRVGKKAAGRLLDGIAHDGRPVA